MKPRKIKLFWTIGAIVLLLASAGVALPPLWPRLFHSEVSDLYRRYEHNPHIRATELHDFPVNDTLAVDVLLLQATDSLGWETLKTDFNIVTLSPQALQMLKNSKSSVGVRMTPKNDIGAPGDTVNLDNNYLLAIDNLEHSVGIFYTKNDQEREQTWHYHLYNFKTPKTNEQNN